MEEKNYKIYGREFEYLVKFDNVQCLQNFFTDVANELKTLLNQIEVRSEMFVHPDTHRRHQADRHQHVDTELHDQRNRTEYGSVIGFLFS